MNPANVVRPDVTQTGSGAADTTRLACFGFLWAFAVLYHQVGYGVHQASLADQALVLAAIVAMVWPTTPSVLGVLAVAHVGIVLRNLPGVYNHWYFAALVSIGIAAACLGTWWRNRGAVTRLPPAQVAQAFRPAAVLCLVLLYAASGFHKLNRDFFDPAVSCAPILGDGMTSMFAFAPTASIAMASILLTVTTELGLPLLLLVNRFRRVGLVIALLFHVAMSLAGYPRFSAAGVALLALLLADGALVASWHGWAGRLVAASRLPVASTVGRLALVVVLIMATIGGEHVAGPVFLVTQLLLTVGVLALAIRSPARVGADEDVPIRFRWSQPMVAPALVLMTAVSPYLGLGTSRALAMYSNLRTEGGVSNHLIVPATLQPFDFQRDLVTIIASSVPRVQRLADDSMAVPFLELRALLSTDGSGGVRRDGSVTYLRGGQRHEVSSIGSNPALDLPVSWFVLKFVRFRAIESSGQRRCGV